MLKNVRSTKIIILVFITTFLLFFFNLQKSLAQVQSSDISINTYPAYPVPGEGVKITLSGYATDLDKAYIVWSVDGQERFRGIGKKSFFFTTDKDKNQYQVAISIGLVDGTTIAKNTLISMAAVDLLWESVDSYVPPFYKGKTLVAKEGWFKIVAMPNNNSFKTTNPNNLSYVWKKDDSNQMAWSGFGKNFFVFKNNYIDQSNDVEVTVSDIEGRVKAVGRVTTRGLPSPKVLLYYKDPKTGFRLNQLINDSFRILKTTTIVASPYFFSPNNINSEELSFQWLAGGQTIQPNKNRNEITVTPPKESGGTNISVLVENVNSFYQSVKKNIDVDF